MKYNYILLALLSVLAFGCKKNSDDPGSNPGGPGDPNGKLVYTVEGVKDITLEQLGSANMTLLLKKLSGSTENVNLEVVGEPEGLTVGYEPGLGKPTYTALLKFTATRVANGTYPLTLLAINATSDTQSYNFNLVVKQYTNPAVAFNADFTESHNCSQSGQASHTAHIQPVDAVKGRILIKGFWSPSWNSEIYANLDQGTKTLDIPEQFMNALTFKGSGTYNDNQLTINYTVTGAVVNESCTATFTRK